MISGMRVRRRSSAGGKKGYRFYRLWITAAMPIDTNQVRPGVAELNLVGPSTPTGVPSGGTATGTPGSNPSNEPPAAFDGHPGTGWLPPTGTTAPWWLQYEFAEPVELTEYRIQARNYVGGAASAPSDFQFQASTNGSTWDTLDTQTNQTGWTASEIRVFPLT